MSDPADWQIRLIAEKAEVEVRLRKLTEFVDSDAFRDIDSEGRALLLEQRKHMNGYLDVLRLRVARFES